MPNLGQKLIGGEVRDAIHVAIIPVVARQDLNPGEHVGLDKNYIEGYGVTNYSTPKVGIIDPYITEPIKKGDLVYLCLYPNTVEDMTHSWKHHLFKKDIVNEKHDTQYKLEQLLRESNCHISIAELIKGIQNNDSIWVGDDDSLDGMNDNKFEILDLVEELTSTKAGDDVYFRCAC